MAAGRHTERAVHTRRRWRCHKRPGHVTELPERRFMAAPTPLQQADDPIFSRERSVLSLSACGRGGRSEAGCELRTASGELHKRTRNGAESLSAGAGPPASCGCNIAAAGRKL